MDALPDNTALLMIDVQRGFDSPKLGRRNNLRAEDNCARLLECWRRAGYSIFHTRYLSDEPGSSLRAGQSGVEFKASKRPGGSRPGSSPTAPGIPRR